MKSILTVIALTIIPGAVFAQDDMPSAGKAMGGSGGGDNVVYKKETEYDFEADDDEANIGAETHGKTSSLIKIRSDFVPEMLKSVEDI